MLKLERTKMLNFYLIKLAGRLGIFFCVLFLYLSHKALVIEFMNTPVYLGIRPLHVLWLVFMGIMLLHLFPTGKHSMALRKAEAAGVDIDSLGSIDPSYLGSDSAYTLAKLLYRVPEVVLEAAEKYEPSIVTRHLVDIAQSFNKFYHDEHILVDDENERTAKLALVKASKTVIANCLGLLGIAAPERM